MAIDLGHMRSEPLPPGFEVRQIKDMESLRICSDITAEVFEVPRDMWGTWWNLIRDFGIDSTRRWFLGLLNGKPVSTSLLVLHEDAAGVYMVATLKEARRKGAGFAMTREPLLLARDVGHRVAVIEASEMGFPVYERLGFRELCEFRTFVRLP